MSKPVTAAIAAASMLLSGVAAPAMAQNYRYDRYYGDRGNHYGHYNQSYRRGYYDGRRYDRRYNDRRYYRRDRDNNGAALAAGVLGFALGAAIVGSQRSPNYGTNSHQQYCASKYRSYDWRSDTYMGYDGYRHYCR